MWWCRPNSQTLSSTYDVALIEREGLSLICLGDDMRRSHHLWSIHFSLIFSFSAQYLRRTRQWIFFVLTVPHYLIFNLIMAS